MLAALMMHIAHVDVDVPGQLTIGDMVVGAGTLLLAIFTWRLARYTSRVVQQTYELDRRTAARERKRRERQVRGIARLVDGELHVVSESIAHAFRTGHWGFYLATPRGAWDRDGAIIAETVPEDEAFALITAFSQLSGWQGIVARMRERAPDQDSIEINESSKSALAEVDASIKEARRHLAALAYPDGRDLEPDPDVEPPVGSRPPARPWPATDGLFGRSAHSSARAA